MNPTVEYDTRRHAMESQSPGRALTVLRLDTWDGVGEMHPIDRYWRVAYYLLV